MESGRDHGFLKSMVEVYFIKGIIVGCGMRLCQMH